MGITLLIQLNQFATFNLAQAVCNHGFFMLPPNEWDSNKQVLNRPIRVLSGSSYMVSISQKYDVNYLYVYVHDIFTSHLPSKHKDEILEQVSRMVRISTQAEDDVRLFHQLHPAAKESGFGRMIRSPSFFEDVVKSILLCSCGWKRSIEMADALCQLESALSPSSRQQHIIRNFPNAELIARLSKLKLNKYCKLGYRAKFIIRFARSIKLGKIDVHKLESLALQGGGSETYSKVETELKKIYGAGDFVVANLAMCLGFYHRVPIDSETKRHIREVHGKVEVASKKKKCIEKDVEEIYDKYAPYQSLAYWFELIDGYEKALGTKLSELSPSNYALVTGNSNTPILG